MSDGEDELYTVILSLKTALECKAFFRDLCTPKEIKGMTDRLVVAKFLLQGDLSYREIHQKTQASLTTITRVARFLTQEPYQGYKLVLGKKDENNNINNNNSIRISCL